VAESLETARHPFTVGRGLDHNAGSRPRREGGGEAFGLGADAMLDHLTVLGEDVDLAFPLVDVDATMVNGWPLPSAALTAECSCGALCHHVKREASRFTRSTLRHWAYLMRRAFDIAVLACPRCGGRLCLIATVEDPDAIRAIFAARAISRERADRAPPFAASLETSLAATISA
jgi:hypothetical protein